MSTYFNIQVNEFFPLYGDLRCQQGNYNTQRKYYHQIEWSKNVPVLCCPVTIVYCDHGKDSADELNASSDDYVYEIGKEDVE